VSPGTFEFLGIPVPLGRVMQPADYEPDGALVFVLRYKTWVKTYGADPAREVWVCAKSLSSGRRAFSRRM